MGFRAARWLCLAIGFLLLAVIHPAWAAFGDCAPIGGLDNFEASAPPQTRTFDARDFRVTEAGEEKTVQKSGAVCQQSYDLKPGMPAMSGLEIMRNYAEGLPAIGATITNPKRAGNDDLYASMTSGGAEYWVRVWESNGNGLHVLTVRTVPFKPSLAPLADKDCAPIPALLNFATDAPPQTRTYDTRNFQVTEDNQEKTVQKAGAVCLQSYELKPGVVTMSGLEIMRNYAEGLPAMGATITNPKRAGDDDLYASMTSGGAEYWVRVWESNGNGLHVLTVRSVPFKPSLVPLADKDCAPIPALLNFATDSPPQTRTYDTRNFQVTENNQEKTVQKAGAVCQQNYELKPGVVTMSGLEIMRNYADGLPAMGATITNPKRAGDDDLYASMTSGGAEYWVRVWESNGNGLHVLTVRTVPFKPSLAPLADKDCPPVPALLNFAASAPPATKGYDSRDFRITEGTEEKTVTKTGAVCQQDYELKPGVATMSGLEIRRWVL